MHKSNKHTHRCPTDETLVPGVSDVVVQDLQASVWFGDVALMVRDELRAVVRGGKHTGVGRMEQTSPMSHGLQHSGLNLYQTQLLQFTLTLTHITHTLLSACKTEF